ncbi:type I methionyl aminopeptidase [Metabacillus iocasae]|uniref:Methionine aminopeptidase n=1 Tax=Priestia iocasae TaxID=2291674 RepID=A0ABS2QW06_9BACI|nr:type I methionyl aminopeptidase [Metabacillus iocasae]MBM7703649.1 methionyl aminopeptidase [Metabacillus iocasae]
MIELKSMREIEEMKKPNQLVAGLHKELAKMIKPGITTMEIEKFAIRYAKKHGAETSLIGYKGFQYATCASVNDVVAHGFPNDQPLKSGDIVTIDTVFDVNGWKGDSAWSYAVGEVSEEAQQLLKVTEECLYLGIEQAVIGNRIGDISHAIQQHAEKYGYGIVTDLAAHGIGRKIHEEPSFLHAGLPGKGVRIKEGMTFTIEPMLNRGERHIYIEDDGWTARTSDGSLSAQYEHTIAVTKEGPVILTKQ